MLCKSERSDVQTVGAFEEEYLELSFRYPAPLTTLDGKLQRAAKQMSITIFKGRVRT